MSLIRLLSLSSIATSLVAGTMAFATPQVAEACGGTFCDAGPQAMPVDQTGENILFIIDGQHVEAHIQIQYDPNTEADEFAWVIPLQALPTFSVGSDPLFNNILNGTVPSFLLNTQSEFCGGGDGESNGSMGPGGSTGAGDSATGGSETDGGPEIVHRDVVGAFEVTVLQGGTVESLMQWLGDNGYQQDPNAEPIFQEYLDEGHLFAAFKLTTGTDVDQIHPVVLEFDTGEACIPLRLTRIAAAEDMAVRSFFLGNARTVPANYKHVLIDPLYIDWLNLNNIAENYNEVITDAVDADQADGHAFVTEYAGSSSVVSQFGLFNDSWVASDFETIDVIDVVDRLDQQGMVQCFGYGECQYNHPLIQGLLNQFLPVPDGVLEGDFYGCLSCYEGLIDQDAWNGPVFAEAYQERIIEPGDNAVKLLNMWPYLTRMYTTISPGEMTIDPIFHQNPDLADVASQQNATQTILCNGTTRIELPDGREVIIQTGDPWPVEFKDENSEYYTPPEENVEQVSQSGAPMVLVDNTALIDEKIELWNRSQNEQATATDAGTDTGGESSSGGSGDGCGCSQSNNPLGALAIGVLVLGLGLTRRRRD